MTLLQIVTLSLSDQPRPHPQAPTPMPGAQPGGTQPRGAQPRGAPSPGGPAWGALPRWPFWGDSARTGASLVGLAKGR